jgi:hypothetical protein
VSSSTRLQGGNPVASSAFRTESSRATSYSYFAERLKFILRVGENALRHACA